MLERRQRSLRPDHAEVTCSTTPIVGVNLRWYLANSIFRRAMKGGVPREKVVFLSIHADSLHPSLRGAMAYIPGAQLRDRLVPQEGRDLSRPAPKCASSRCVTHSREEALRGRGAVARARGVGDRVVSRERPGASIRSSRCATTSSAAARSGFPPSSATTRSPRACSSRSATSATAKDRELMKTKKYRQQLAEAIYAGHRRLLRARAKRRAAVGAARSGQGGDEAGALDPARHVAI